MKRTREELLFELALLKPAIERAAFLDAMCDGDAALRQRLESLLAAHEQPDELLETQSETGRPTIKLDLDNAPDESVGQTLGRYKLLERVGEGGCGVVYVAEQTEPVRRRVALKVIKMGMDTKQVVARFEAERQALALMDHPNIARVLDAGTTEKGRPYFVMELVRGIKITDYCDQNNLNTKERLDLFIKVCHAIQHAHQKGIIHRDIKPSNILVTMHDGVPVPKVIDFGIAKATEGRLTDNTVYTQLHQFIGTPAYMSPEQAEMSGLDIDTRSDIYSLGVLLYELLTGKTPFDSQELLRSGIDAMRRTIREKEPARPSTRLSTMDGGDLTRVARQHSIDTLKLIHSVRGDLDCIVMKALEKDRVRRYETANGLAADIGRHLNHEPVLARPAGALYRLQKSVRRNRLAYSAAMAVALALVLGAIVSSGQAVRARAAEKLAKARLAQVAAERDAKEQARLEAEQVSHFLQEVFQSPDPGRDGRTVTVAETIDRAARQLGIDLANQPERRAHMEATLAKTYNALGLQSSAIPLLERARTFWTGKVGEEDRRTIQADIDLVEAYWKAGRIDESVKLGETTRALSLRVNGPDDPATLWAMHHLASGYYLADREEESLRLSEQVLAGRRRNPADRVGLQTALNNLAGDYLAAGRYQEGLKLHEEARELARKVYGPNELRSFQADSNTAISMSLNGRSDEALAILEEVIPRARNVLGPEHPFFVLPLLYLGGARLDHEDKEGALQAGLQANELVRKLYGTEHPESVRVFDFLNGPFIALGRFDQMAKFWSEIFETRQKSKGLEHPTTIHALHQMALAYGLEGNWSEARAQLLRLYSTTNLPDSAHEPLAMLACLEAYLGDRASYEAHRRSTLARFADTKAPEIAERVTKAFLLFPPGPEELKTFETLSQMAVSTDPNHRWMKYFLFSSALCSYRAGDWKAAADQVERSLQLAGNGPPTLLALDYPLLAMARQRLSQPAEARAAFQKGTEILEQRFPLPRNGPATVNWHDLLAASLLLGEAKALIPVDAQ